MLKKGVINNDSCPLHTKKPTALHTALPGQLKVSKHSRSLPASPAAFPLPPLQLHWSSQLVLVGGNWPISEGFIGLETGGEEIF